MDGIERVRPMQPDSEGLLPQHVKRALAFMRTNMAERIALAALTSACGVSERTLLNQFQKFLGLAPIGYLRRIRLNAVRSELTKLGNDEPISEIAIRCGFGHLGRFAAEYRRQFNETPFATRQRARVSAESAGPIAAAPLPGRRRPCLLILPLRTETPQETLQARDLTERLAAALSRMHVASVRLADPSRSLAKYAPQSRNASAEYCLVGRFIHHDERVRVIVRLVDAAANRHLWGDSFDGSTNDPYELQDRVVSGALCRVVAHITDAEIEGAYNRDPRDVGGRELSLQALPLISNANLPSVTRAMALLHRAIDMDPGDATAIALLAYCHAQCANFIATPSLAADRDAALRFSRRAGVLDNSDPLVLAARGLVAAWALRNDEADALAARALSIDPWSAWAWMLRGHTRCGFVSAPERAIADYQRSIQLRGPGISPSSCLYAIGAAHWRAGRFEETVRWVRQALAENPNATWMHRNLSCAAAKLGDTATVARSVDCMRRAQPHMTVSLLVENYPIADPDWLEAITRLGMPLT
jgi:AraC-like DNA-binding protein/TolB-like protein